MQPQPDRLWIRNHGNNCTVKDLKQLPSQKAEQLPDEYCTELLLNNHLGRDMVFVYAFLQEGVGVKPNEWFRGFHEEFSTLQKMVSVGKAGW